MMTRLDHLALRVADVPAAARAQSDVVGREATFGASSEGTTARLQLDNCALVFEVGSPQADTAQAMLGLTFAVADVEAAAHRLTRRALSGTMRPDGQAFDIDPAGTYGVSIRVSRDVGTTGPDKTADIAGLDHVVIRTPDPERAVALYGGRLGLDLRLDRHNPAFGSRMLFFVCGDLVVEVTHDPKKGTGAGPDRVAGLAWRANDIDCAHARMTAKGVTVSEIRTGRRPGTRVCTVKRHTSGVPTLIIGGEGLKRA